MEIPFIEFPRERYNDKGNCVGLIVRIKKIYTKVFVYWMHKWKDICSQQ